MFKSSVFRGTRVGRLFRQTKRFTSTGEPEFALVGSIRYSPIRSELGVTETSVRADKSGSKSRAEEFSFKGRIQVQPDANGRQLSVGDKLDVLDATFHVMDTNPSYHAMDGGLDHILVDLGL